MTMWICIGVYVIGMVVMPVLLSLVDGQPWVTRHQSVGEDVLLFIALILWPVFAVLWLVRQWASFMSEDGTRMYKGIERALDNLKEALDD